MKPFHFYRAGIEKKHDEVCRVDDGRLLDSVQWLENARLVIRIQVWVLPVASRDAIQR
jgi:hypothetical protein